jgi:cyclic beta-1,2-glucan synthetase
MPRATCKPKARRDARLHQPDPAGARRSTCCPTALSRRHQQRGRRLQPLAGSGVTRWREDATRDCWGMFVYLRDVTTGDFWSAAYQPHAHEVKGYEAIFTQSAPEFRQRQAASRSTPRSAFRPRTTSRCGGSPSPTNPRGAREIELTSYAEVVLATRPPTPPIRFQQPVRANGVRRAHLCDPLHPPGALGRRKPPWLLHLMVGQGGEQGRISCETDRSEFVGRGGSPPLPPR